MRRTRSALFGVGMLLLAGVLAASLLHAARGAEPLDIGALCPRSLVAAGDAARLQRVMVQARRGEKVVIAVIGGSITQGAKASTPEQRYGNRIAAWWKQTFPKASIEFVNAGIGATGSNYGALRAQRDLLAHRPDFVVVEYAVNDGPLQEAAETLEGLVRQILREPQQPAALLLFMMHQGGGNAQAWHAKVGAHYGLPMVSYRDALWPEIEAGRLKWETISPDNVHPNDLGQQCAAQFVIHYLEQVRQGLPADNQLIAPRPLPAPLLSDLFEHVTLREGSDLQPVRNAGWTLDQQWHCWRSTQPGSVIEFEIEGRLVCALHLVVRRGMGRAKMQIDGGPPVVRDGWFDQTWGGYRATAVLARDLKPGPHRVRIVLLEEKSAQSDGHEFVIYGLGAAGTTPLAYPQR